MSKEQNPQTVVDLHMKIMDKQVEAYQLAERLNVLLKAILKADKRDQVILTSIVRDYLKPHLPEEDV